MLRIWGKLYLRHRIHREYTAQDEAFEKPVMERAEDCLKEIVHAFDLPYPLWLPVNRKELTEFGSTRFHADHFVEAFPYEALEIEIIEVDEQSNE